MKPDTFYDPKQWRRTEQVCEYLSANHPYRIAGACKVEGQDTAILVNDTTRTVHHLPVTFVRPVLGKVWTLDVLRRLDTGQVPEQTRASRYSGEEAYRVYQR